MADREQLRVAVVGTGNWGRIHIEAYWRNPKTKVVAVCGSSNLERARRMGEQVNAAAYVDMAEMLDRERPDLVSIITPDDQHFAPYKLAIERGVSCFLEKPLTMDVGEAETLVRLARERGIRCGINFNHRYATPFVLAQQHVREGKVGRPLYFHWRFSGGHYPERQSLPLAHLLYMQSHGFNMLQTLGGPVASVSGHAFDPRGTGQFTTAVLTLQFETGAVGTFAASVDGDYKDPDIYQFEMMGERGRIKVDDAIRRFEFAERASSEQTHQEQKGAESLALVWNSHFFDDESRDFGRTTDRHIDHFVDCMLRGEPEPIPVEEGLAALKLGRQAIDSILK